MSRRKVLYVSHNHPAVRPGGAEAYALELYEAMRDSDEFEPYFIARSGPPVSTTARPHEGTLFTGVNEDSNQYFFYTDFANFDWFYGTSPDKEIYTKYFHEFLDAYKPDIIHFQHTLFFGYDLIRHIKNVLPEAKIVYTLHEYLPICHRQGQMVRTEHRNEERCLEESPRRCHECFPEISPQAFFMRKRFVQSHLSLVDLFLAPSHFLLERYVEWGIPREKIRFEEYGRKEVYREVVPQERETRNRIGFFGQFNYFKGVHVLLEAMKLLVEDGCEAHLWLHGANLELQPEEFRNRLNDLIEQTEENTTLIGRYDHAALPRLMASVDWVVVPSVWWENSPLVIQEAFLHGKPVICSDIGGMAEKVTDGVDGLHFRVEDPHDLAEVLTRAVSSPDLWQKLHDGISDIYTIEDAVQNISDMYNELLGAHATTGA